MSQSSHDMARVNEVMKAEDESDKSKGLFLMFPFTKRWGEALARATKEGGWWVLSAQSQMGKTTANKHYRDTHTAEKRDDGSTIVPVALTCADGTERVLLAALADSIGGARLVRQPQRALAIAKAIVRVGTKTIIVNNGHAMHWQQWRILLTLEELYKARGIDPAIIFSGIHQNVGLATVQAVDGATDQLVRRLQFKEIPGQNRDEVADAMRLLAERDDPALLDRQIIAQAPLIHELLSNGPTAARGGTVATIDIIELSRRLTAVRRLNPDMGADEMVRLAHRHLIQSRTQAPMKTGEAA